MLQGAGYGALSGAAFGAIGFPDNPWKVAAYGGIGGGLSELTGGDFAEGAIVAGGLALMGCGYSKFVDGRDPTGRTSSGNAIDKPIGNRNAAMAKMNQNPNSPAFGLTSPTVSRAHPLSEQSLRWIPNNIPIANDIAFLHDFFAYKIFTNQNTWRFANYPTMVPAAVWTLGGVATYYAPTTSIMALGVKAD